METGIDFVKRVNVHSTARKELGTTYIVDLGDGFTLKSFWDRSNKLWIVFITDANDYQVGNAEYAPNKGKLGWAQDWIVRDWVDRGKPSSLD